LLPPAISKTFQGFIDAIDAYNEQMEKYANQLEADNG